MPKNSLQKEIGFFPEHQKAEVGRKILLHCLLRKKRRARERAFLRNKAAFYRQLAGPSL